MSIRHPSAAVAAYISRFLACIVLFAVCDSTPVLSDEEHEHDHHHSGKRQHSAHEHGTANLNLVVDDKTVQIELLVPAVDITGFGHKPRSPEEKRQESDALETLKQVDKSFSLSKSAACALESVDVLNNGSDAHAEHSEYRAIYQFQCSSPSALSEIKLNVFGHFPSLTTIRGNAVVRGKQSHLNLSKKHNSIAIPKD